MRSKSKPEEPARTAGLLLDEPGRWRRPATRSGQLFIALCCAANCVLDLAVGLAGLAIGNIDSRLGIADRLLAETWLDPISPTLATRRLSRFDYLRHAFSFFFS
jgi:hypothetical protein